MAAFDRGDCREAATGFDWFIAAHPEDPRTEDAAYLGVMALRKCGDERSMKAAAVRYLRRYPAGFRRLEVERLAR
jgi:TolA-binding protein